MAELLGTEEVVAQCTIFTHSDEDLGQSLVPTVGAEKDRCVSSSPEDTRTILGLPIAHTLTLSIIESATISQQS